MKLRRFWKGLSGLGAFLSAAIFFQPAVLADPLEGKIWRQRDAVFISVRDLVSDISAAKVVVVGETHGFKPHQDREAFLLSALADRGHYPTLVLEMLDPEGAAKIADYRKAHPEDSSELGAQLEWWKSGWPAFQFYKPVFDAALQAKLLIAGGDIPAKDQSTLRSAPLKEAAEQNVFNSWKDTMRAAHCGLIEPSELDTTARLQIARDQSMANAAKLVSSNGGALVIAGLAHARADRGVPKHFPSDVTRSVALMETSDSQDARTYLPTSINGKPAYDYIWFTPKRSEEGACERLRRKGLIK